jgi:hypothetical protein
MLSPISSKYFRLKQAQELLGTFAVINVKYGSKEKR